MDELSELILKYKKVRQKIEKLKEDAGCGYLDETGELLNSDEDNQGNEISIPCEYATKEQRQEAKKLAAELNILENTKILADHLTEEHRKAMKRFREGFQRAVRNCGMKSSSTSEFKKCTARIPD